MHGPKFTTKEFIEALKGTGGIKAQIAKKLGCNWDTINNYIKKYKAIKVAYDNEVQIIGDLAETKLIESIRSGDNDMIKFYLRTRCKDRGYVERQENDHSVEIIIKTQTPESIDEGQL